MKPITLPNAFRLYQSDCKARNLSPRTLEANEHAFRSFIAFLAEENPTVNHVSPFVLRNFLTATRESKSSSTAARFFDVLSPFLGWCVSEGVLSVNPIANIQKPKKMEAPITPLSLQQIDCMIKACRNDFAGIRNKLIIALLFDTGMRASELTTLSVGDVNLDQQVILVRHGKGNKTRVVPYGNSTARLLNRYLAHRGELSADALIVTSYGQPTDRTRIRTIIVTAAKKAGFKATTHLLRHSCAVAMIRNGCDVFSVQKLLGHSTLAMTKRYSQLADADVQEKHKLFSPADRVASLSTNGRKQLK